MKKKIGWNKKVLFFILFFNSYFFLFGQQRSTSYIYELGKNDSSRNELNLAIKYRDKTYKSGIFVLSPLIIDSFIVDEKGMNGCIFVNKKREIVSIAKLRNMKRRYASTLIIDKKKFFNKKTISSIYVEKSFLDSINYNNHTNEINIYTKLLVPSH